VYQENTGLAQWAHPVLSGGEKLCGDRVTVTFCRPLHLVLLLFS
jgi:hypothetical protein